MSPLSFDNGWKDGNADCCVNTADEQTYYGYKFGVNFEILECICMGGNCREANIRSVLFLKVIRYGAVA